MWNLQNSRLEYEEWTYETDLNAQSTYLVRNKNKQISTVWNTKNKRRSVQTSILSRLEYDVIVVNMCSHPSLFVYIPINRS